MDEENLKQRPTSRRGMKDDRHFNTMNENRPATSLSRAAMRPPSAQSYNKTPGTASRLGTAMMQPPKTASLPGVNVLDRPITQQGLSGMRTATRGQQYRQVLDKRFYEGQIQMKTREINAEIVKLNEEIENQNQQQSSYLIYEKKVREIAAELTELQGELADYNLVVDKVNTSTDKTHIESECREVKVENDRLADNLEQLFAQNRNKQQHIQQIEMDIENEKHSTQKLIAQMTDSDLDKYNELKEFNQELQKEIENLQQKLDMMTQQKNDLEDKISGSQMRREAVRLYHKLKEREDRKNSLEEEERNRSTPAQEREQLLQRVKEDNAEMAAMDRQIAQINEQLKKKKEELEQIEQDLEESQSDRHQKYKELKKREETMEQFMSTFDEVKEAEIDRINKEEEKIVGVLRQISRNLLGAGKLPSYDEFAIMKENLSVKQEELEKSKATVEELAKEQQQLSTNLNKIEELEDKINNEMSDLKEKIISMTNEMKQLENLDELRAQAQEKKQKLLEEKDLLTKQRPGLQENLKIMKEKHEELFNQLKDNETYIQLNNLEKKLNVIEQNNASIKELIDSKKTEMDYDGLKQNALKLVNIYNDKLKESLRKS